MKSEAAGKIESREREFHDSWAEGIDPREVPVVESFTTSTCPETRWILSQMESLKGKKLLELGSGAGEGAVYFAMQGANVTASDLSPAMLEVVKRVAKLHGTTVETQICSAEDLSCFGDNTFDVVYGANLLHHVDIRKCLPEVKRVLKPGGIGAFWDPVEYNPVIGVYRKMAMGVRTIDEHPIRTSDLKFIREQFSTVDAKFFWLTALLIFVKFYLIDRIHPSQDRYWKRIISHEREIRGLYGFLAGVDRFVLSFVPGIKWWCWNVAVIARK